MAEPSAGAPSAVGTQEKRLDSWKEIAAYLNRDVTTVQRWEKREGMPVHRHVHNSRGSVYALSSELDSWSESRRLGPATEDDTAEPEMAATADVPDGSQDQASQGQVRGVQVRPVRRAGLWFALAAVLIVVLPGSVWFAYRKDFRSNGQMAIHSLAVLPMRNLSGDPAQDYLADGMTEALIGRLAEIHNLRVISHTSVMRFSNPQISVPEIAKILGVDAVVEGSVTQQGSQIRVTAQLIRGATDEHLWSQTYDREIRDALTLQSELAQSIAGKVEVTVTGEERQRLTATRSVAPEVYESYLKGGFVLNHVNTKAEIEQAIDDFNDAIGKDATFAPAYLGLADAYTVLGTVFGGGSPAETRPKVTLYARKALALDPDLADAHVILANTLQREWHWAEAESEYRRALELNPNDAQAQAGFALWLLCEGRTDEAVEAIQRAQQLDPSAVGGSDVSWILFQAHRFDEAIRQARSAQAVRPDDANVLTGLGFILIANNQAAEAIPVLEKARALSKGSVNATSVLIRAYAHAGHRREALQLLDELKAQKKTGYVPAAGFVNAYLGLGDKEEAFYWLEEAYKEQSNILQFVKTHPYFDPIRNDPRFADLVRRVGLD
jgi:TolB-like protein/Flp pilus assembly protein TadD